MAERENIRSRLKKHQLTQVWLINQLGLRGIVTDKTEMSSVLAGTRSGSKADAIIELSHDILDLTPTRWVQSQIRVAQCTRFRQKSLPWKISPRITCLRLILLS